MNDELLLKKLRWRCRRGTQELDAMLGAYLESKFDRFSTTQGQLFSQLLQLEDDVLWDWLSGQIDCPEPRYQALINDIRNGH